MRTDHPGLLFAVLLLAGCGGGDTETPPTIQRVSQAEELETRSELEEAVALYAKQKGEAHRSATDPFERLDSVVNELAVSVPASEGRYEDIFLLGDEAFEAERDRAAGFGLGPQPQAPLPARPQRIQQGELGGLDSSSCRSCHFFGGPDGAGTLTQAGLFRGDGSRLSSAANRQAPHIMGLGYISILAREMEAELRADVESKIQESVLSGEIVEAEVFAKGVSFGFVTAFPSGVADKSGIRGVSADLVIRPFGHKGRHSDLVALADEALQLHHGQQSSSRIREWSDSPSVYLGSGSEFDPDDDGVQVEAGDAQAVLLGTYMSLLPIPEIRLPTDAALALEAARGSSLFESFGCAGCHVPRLSIHSFDHTLQARAGGGLEIELDLAEAGLDPKPQLLDFGPVGEDLPPEGTPLFAFTDLRRHDMGPELADVADEPLPGTEFSVPASVWLTRSLWGLADTAPYLHDGRAPTVHDAIVLHGGEADPSRQAYLAAGDSDRAAVRLFLSTLTRGATMVVE